jgi:hypothetical protein
VSRGLPPALAKPLGLIAIAIDIKQLGDNTWRQHGSYTLDGSSAPVITGTVPPPDMEFRKNWMELPSGECNPATDTTKSFITPYDPFVTTKVSDQRASRPYQSPVVYWEMTEVTTISFQEWSCTCFCERNADYLRGVKALWEWDCSAGDIDTVVITRTVRLRNPEVYEP